MESGSGIPTPPLPGSSRGKPAIGFVVCATLFSLCTQAYFLGRLTSTLASQFGVSPSL